MRVAPLGLATSWAPATAFMVAAESSAVTHGYQGSIPGRMLAHGAESDFLAVVPAAAEEEHFGKLAALLAQEVGFARTLWDATKTGTLGDGVQVIHRPLVTNWPVL